MPVPHRASQVPPRQGQSAPRGSSLPDVRHIIAVASGKGGVGKSTTGGQSGAGRCATRGFRSAFSTLTFTAPSLPKLLGLRGQPELGADGLLQPLDGFGLKVMSIGFLVEEETPMIWRGPMVMSAITQMLREVAWGKLDVLVVDMPPGTGDAQLTMAQQVPAFWRAVIVSTPQDLALIDARRGIAMFQRVNVPCLGLIENMSYFPVPRTAAPRSRHFRSWGGTGRGPAAGRAVPR